MDADLLQLHYPNVRLLREAAGPAHEGHPTRVVGVASGAETRIVPMRGIGGRSVRACWPVANEVGFKGDSLEKCLHIETVVYLEDIPIAGQIEPKEVPWDKEVVEESVASDLFTVNYRRAFRSLIDKVTASYASAS